MENLQELKPVGKLTPFAHFCCTIGNLPTSYMISLTYEEQLLWLCQYLEKTVIPAVNTNAEAVAELQNLYIQLKEYVDNYFTNLDVQQEINNKLDEMAQSGELQEIISAYLELQVTFTYDTITELKNATNLQNGSFAQTLGFHSLNDGGKAIYKIRNINVGETVDEAFLVEVQNNLVAELIVDNVVNVKTMGAYGDNEHDDTIAIQKALDSNYDVYFPNGTYKVTKNTGLNFADNDEPCLAIINKTNKKITGANAKIKTTIHAQGIFEIINSAFITIEGLEIEGLGIFPAIDGVTGRAEKGTNDAGYNTQGFWGYYKNNSFNTSENITHGNNGNPWGMFNGGYIGNIGNGILIHNNCRNIKILNNNIHGFNYSGVEVGFSYDRNYNYNDSKNIEIAGNTIYNCYDTGINLLHCESVNNHNNTIYDIGHPNARYTDTYVDPRLWYNMQSRRTQSSKNCFNFK